MNGTATLDAHSSTRQPTSPRPSTSDRGPVSTRTLPCQVDTQLFFAEQERDVDQAKALCSACPLRAACLMGAIERREPWGVWGGEVFVEGSIVAHKRGRGRPRKHPLSTAQQIRSAA